VDKLAPSTINLDKTPEKEKFPQKESEVMTDADFSLWPK
jgi:hypothetical protein